MGRLFDDLSSQSLEYAGAVVAAMPFTLSCWFQADDAALVGTLMAIDGNGSSGWHRLVVVGTASPKQLRANSADTSTGSNQANATVTAWTANTWQHACGVFASTTDRRVFLNGTKATDTTSIAAATLAGTRIGRVQTASPQYWSGLIAEAAVFTGALADADVAALAAGCCPLRIAGCVEYWLQAANVQQASPEPSLGSGGHAMTLVNAPTVSTVQPPVGGLPSVFTPEVLRRT